MAQIKISALVSDIRGKFAGSVFQQNNGILSLRNRNLSINQKSNNQLLQRGQTKELLQVWMNFTSAEQTVWNNFAKQNKISSRKNSVRALSGQFVFFKFNTYRLSLGLPLLLVPSLANIGCASVTYSLMRVGNLLFLVADRVVDSALEFPFIKISHVVNNNINYKSNTCKAIRGMFVDATSFNITAAYLAAFGCLPNIGSTVFLDYSICNVVSGHVNYMGNFKVVVGTSTGYNAVLSDILDIYSTDCCITGYTGPVIKLYRSISGSYRTFYFVNGALDYVDIASFANGQTLYVVELYSQLGNGHIMLSIDTPLMPIFTPTGEIITSVNTAMLISTAWNVASGQSKSFAYKYKALQNSTGWYGRKVTGAYCEGIWSKTETLDHASIDFHIWVNSTTPDSTGYIGVPIVKAEYNTVFGTISQAGSTTYCKVRANGVESTVTKNHLSICSIYYMFDVRNFTGTGYVGSFRTFSFFKNALTSSQIDLIG